MATVVETRKIAPFDIEARLFDELDRLAGRRGITRTACLRVIIQEAVERGDEVADATSPVGGGELRALSERLHATTTELDRVLRQNAKREGQIVAERQEATEAAARGRAATLAAVERHVGEVLAPVNDHVAHATAAAIERASAALENTVRRAEKASREAAEAVASHPALFDIDRKLEALRSVHQRIRPVTHVHLGGAQLPVWAWWLAALATMLAGAFLLTGLTATMPADRVAVAVADRALGPGDERLCQLIERRDTDFRCTRRTRSAGAGRGK